jgi:RHS repeat-associated protein
MGEKFDVQASSGTGSAAVPLATSPGRQGLRPDLSVYYDSGTGNGAYGFGWALRQTSIRRKVDKGGPRYLDPIESDVFILSDAEDLVPLLDQRGNRIRRPRRLHGVDYEVCPYRPRVEGAFARVERWFALATGVSHWRIITRDNVTTLYGFDANSRVAASDDPRKVFDYLPCQSFDDAGNLSIYDYVAEDGVGVPNDAHEANRLQSERTVQRYLKRIRYGNVRPYVADFSEDGSDSALPDVWLFELVLDYGDHDLETPTPTPDQPWPVRPDPYSSYRSGFDVRTYRRCRRALLFHHFPDEPDIGASCLVRSTDFSYDDDVEPVDDNLPVYSFMRSATQVCYRRTKDGYRRRSLPPVEFEYSRPRLHTEVQTVPPASLENLPEGLDGAVYLWLDLDGEGTPGVLTDFGNAWGYKRNLSAARPAVGSPTMRLGPLEMVPALPAANTIAGHRFTDLSGDGQLDLVDFNAPNPGFYERTQDGFWEGFRPFESLPIVNLDDPNSRLVDLSGDGLADLISVDDHGFRINLSLGEEGFASASVVDQPGDERLGPHVVFSDGIGTVFLADMSGDGLSDIVRVRNGDVCYWPSLGYGRFGAKVTMDHAPRFTYEDEFDPRRVRLADIDGSGTSDLLYIGADGVTLSFNLSGNSWAKPQKLAVFPYADSLGMVQVLDLLGSGTACLVWSSPLPQHATQPMRYVDLMGGVKPHLLVGYRNNFGAETRVHYAPSTRFYVDDKLAGHPWVTRVPYPVHVVDRVEIFDWVGRTRLVRQFAYHDGFFDGHEREFRGFALVEQWDTEEQPDDALFGDIDGDNWESTYWTPPTYTKTWFHTGAAVESGDLPREIADDFWIEPEPTDGPAGPTRLTSSQLPTGLSAEELREAHRAQKGVVLRQETYAADGSSKAAIPYSVSQQTYEVRLLQLQGINRHAVFYVHPLERVSFEYERNPADPRVSQEFVLEVDDFGNVLRRVSIAYPRRRAAVDLDPRVDDAFRRMLIYDQSQVRVLATGDSYTNPLTDADVWPDCHRVPRLAETIEAELSPPFPTPEDGNRTPRISRDEVQSWWALLWAGCHDVGHEVLSSSDVDGDSSSDRPLRRRIVQRSRTQYRANDLSHLLPLGRLESRASVGETYTLAITDGQVDLVLGGLPEEELHRGGYVRQPNSDGWWSPSGRIFYSAGEDDPAAELDEARRHFFLPRRTRDPFGAVARTHYDAYDLLVDQNVDALGNTIAAANDYRVLQPFRITDANGNRAEVAYDVMGLVVAGAMMGKLGEDIGDSLAGFDPDLDDARLIRTFVEPLEDPGGLLQDATWRVLYDPQAFFRSGPGAVSPIAVHTIRRERHVSQATAGEEGRYLHSLSYWDGFGRESQRKALARPGPVDGVGDSDPRWQASGWTIFNNKGAPTRQFEPRYTATHQFEFNVRVGVSTTVFYDPLERVVARLRPDRTWEKTVFDSWHRQVWDANDTVGISDPRADPDVGSHFRRLLGDAPFMSWYEQRVAGSGDDARSRNTRERDAALKAAVHGATPTVLHFDPLGHVCLSVADDGLGGRYPSRTVSDFAGRPLAIFDSKGRRLLEYFVRILGPDDRAAYICGYDLSGNPLFRNGMDEGWRRSLLNVAGNPIRTMDARGSTFWTIHDLLQRPTHFHVKRDDGSESLLERYLYGEAMPERNLRGRLARQCDGAGVLINERYDFKGNLTNSARHLGRAHTEAIDWSPLEDVTGERAFDSAAAQFVESNQRYVTNTSFDALDRPVQTVAPHRESARASAQRLGYDEGGQLTTVDVWVRRGASDDGPLDPTAADIHAVRSIDYNARGQRLGVVAGNGVVSRYEYDPETFRVRRIRAVRPRAQSRKRVLQDLSYTYDPVGNITSIDDHADFQNVVYFRNQRVDPSSAYTYDALYRLTRATGREHLSAGRPDARTARQVTDDDARRMRVTHPSDGQAMARFDESYRYDGAGNILEVHHGSGGGTWRRSYAYGERSQIMPAEIGNRLSRTSQPGDERDGPWTGVYEYDTHGNMLCLPHLPHVEWDNRDRLHATTRQWVDEGTPRTTYYVYDASGERKRKVTDRSAAPGENPARQCERVYFGGLELYREYGGRERLTLERETIHVMVGADRIALVEMRTAGRDRGPELLVRYQYANHLGTAVLELDDEAQIISYEEYFPYGSTSYQAVRSRLETPKRYRYSGKERDEENGFYYHGKRYYAPWLGRWTAPDPVGTNDGLNLYQYVSGNPVRLIDPQGTGARWDRFMGGVKMVGGALETAAGVALVAAGAATSEIGVGIPIAAAGVFVTAHGADVTVSGARTMWNGAPVDTFTSQGLQAAGMSRTGANLTDAGISIVGTLGAGAVTRAPGVAAAVTDSATATEGATQTANSVSLAFKPGVLTPGHNMVGVTTEAGTEWTHLVVGPTARTSGVVTAGASEVVTASGPSAAYTITTVPRTAAQAEAALTAARTSVGPAGNYAIGVNDCSSYAASVLRAGGVATPPVTSPAINFFSVALQSPGVVGPVSLTGATVSTAVGANVLFSGDAPDSSMPVDLTSSSAPTSSQASPYTPADSSNLVCTPDDVTADYESMVCTP